MARCFVTGSAGLIASNLVEYLLNYGHTVYSIDNLSTGDIRNVSERAKRNFHIVDCRNRNMVNLIMKMAKPEICYHLSALAHEGLSQFCPNLILENNLNASMNVLVAAIKNKVRRFIFTSSMATYGEQKVPFEESMIKKPQDVYGVSKAAFEDILAIMSQVYGFEYVIIRPHNIYGPYMALGDPYRQVVGIFMNRLMQDKHLFLYGDGNQKRALSFVGDFTPALAEAGFNEKAKNQIFNIGADKPYSINELAQMLIEISGKKVEIKHIEDRPMEVDFAWCNNDKAKGILGFKDKTSLYDGLKMTYEWAKVRGPQEPKYLPYLELVNEKCPITWKNRLL